MKEFSNAASLQEIRYIYKKFDYFYTLGMNNIN